MSPGSGEGRAAGAANRASPLPRSFEYQGEDPFLAYHMAYAETLGIQSQNVSGCVKHFVFNNGAGGGAGARGGCGAVCPPSSPAPLPLT